MINSILLVYAPSGRRMIPYPPVGIGVLAEKLIETGVSKVKELDLEIELWNEYSNTSCYKDFFNKNDTKSPLKNTYKEDYPEFSFILEKAIFAEPFEGVGISVMGFRQLASALIIARLSINRGLKVCMGGQYWTNENSQEIKNIFNSELLEIVVGDGWQKISQWATVENNEVKAVSLLDIGSSKKSSPPQPSYVSVNWKAYQKFCEDVYGDYTQQKRAHLYIWDKLCPYKCNFCRVSSGSNVKLTNPIEIAKTLQQYISNGITQFNFMTNELNPTVKYLRRFLTAIEDSIDQEELSKIGWFTYLRPDDIELSDFLRLREAGCRLVRFGVETGSQSLSNRMEKEYCIETIEKVLERSSQAGILNHVNFLIGYPGETEHEFSETVKFVERNRHNIHSIRINPFYLPPGTSLANEPEKYGLELGDYKGGYYEFQTKGCDSASKDQVLARINILTKVATNLGIGFCGVLPFFTLNELVKHGAVETALDAIKMHSSYLWNNTDPDRIKSIFGRYDEINKSKFTNVYARGDNYNMTVCMD